MAALARYGKAIGLAFQITDDLLDVRGTAAEMGKRVQKDHRRGKLTFPGLLGVDQSIERAGSLVREATAALAPFGRNAVNLVSLAQSLLERTR